MNIGALDNGWFVYEDPLFLGWWWTSHENDVPLDSGAIDDSFPKRVVDYVSRRLPVPVEVVNTDINISISHESTYFDTRKTDWVILESGSADTLTIPASMPSNSIDCSRYGGLTFKCVFDNKESASIYPLVDSNGYPSFLPSLFISGIYENSNGSYESDIYGLDLFGYSSIAFYKTGLTGSVTILGIFY